MTKTDTRWPELPAAPTTKRAPTPRVSNPTTPEPVAAAAEPPTIIVTLRDACEAGATGTLVARRGHVAPLIDSFAGTGLSARVGFLNSACIITVARELRDVLATVTSSGMFLRGAERFPPEFGKPAVTDADLLKHLESLIDRNATAALPVLILLDESVGFEDTAALRELAARRRVGIVRIVESEDGPATPEWRPDGR